MMPASETRILDANAEALGTDLCTLMGNAGNALVKVLKQYSGKKFLFVCGTGNNGGDGFAAAGLMKDEDVTVCLMKPETSIRSDISRKYFSALNCPVIMFDDLVPERYDVLVDCGLGTGTKGSIKSPYDNFIKISKTFKGTIISADIPTGLGCDMQVKPDITVSFQYPKTGMTEENSGEIVVADIGIPEDALRIVGPGDMLRYPVPLSDSHKGCNGRVMIVGGGPYIGAPAMSGLSALRVGADIVNIATPEGIAGTVASFSPAFTFHPLADDGGNSRNILLPSHVPELLKFSVDYDTVLIGPGLGTDEDTLSAVRMFVSGCGVPMVIDADGITAVESGFKASAPIVFTPHKREFERLGRKFRNADDVADIAKSLNAVILLKGKEDIISDGKHTRMNRTGNPAMTVAGTGDVLAGIVAGLLSKGLSAFDAACLGAYICGKAGDRGFESHSYGMIATDVIDEIPNVLKEGLSKQ